MSSFLWVSSFLILAICIMRWLFEKCVSRTHIYSLWLLAGIILPVIGLPLLGFSNVHRASSWFSIQNLEIVVEDWITEEKAALKDTASKSSEMIGFEADMQISGEMPEDEPEGSVLAGVEVIDEQAGIDGSGGSLNWPIDKMLWYGIWICGIFVIGAWMILVNRRLKNELKEKRVAFSQKSSHQFTEEWLTLPVYLVKDLSSPCLMEVDQETAIYLPDFLLSEPDSLRHALAHEICHYQQKDLWWNKLRCILLAVYWFHPLVWLAAWVSRQDCELACDERAIKLLGEEERFSYGRTLLSLVTVSDKAGGMVCGGTWMTAGAKSLQGRISQLATGSKITLWGILGFYFLMGLVIAASTTSSLRDGAMWRAEKAEAKLAEEKIQEAKMRYQMGTLRALGSGENETENAEIREELAHYLTEHHLLYVGDASGSGRIMGVCLRAIGFRQQQEALGITGSTELQTGEQPYLYRLIFETSAEEILETEKLETVSILAFASIENLGGLEIYLSPDGYEKGELFWQISREEACELYGISDLSLYGKFESQMLRLVQMVERKMSEDSLH